MVTQEDVYKAIEIIEQYRSEFHARMAYLNSLGNGAKNELTKLVNMSHEFSSMHSHIEGIKANLESIKNREYER